MIAAAHQPLFIPWIGYFNKISKTDLFVIVDNVQFTTAGWIRRNTIKGTAGAQKIIVPIKEKEHIGQSIKDVLIDNSGGNSNWREKHIRTFTFCYRKAAYFNEIMTFLEKSYSREWKDISNFNIELIRAVCEYLEITTKVIISSESNIQGGKTDLIVDICEKTGADTFILGMGGSSVYADREYMASKGINVIMQEFRHPEYPQLFGDFVPKLSILDLLFNMGRRSKDIVRSCSQ
jgi:hypothetical protein